MNAEQWEQVEDVRRLFKDGVARGLRQVAGVSMADVARIISVTRVTLGRWENGERKPQPRHALVYFPLLELFRRMAQQ